MIFQVLEFKDHSASKQKELRREDVFEIVSKIESKAYDDFATTLRGMAEFFGIAKTYSSFQISKEAAEEAASFFARETGKTLDLEISNSSIEKHPNFYMGLLAFQYTKTFKKILEVTHSENATSNMLEYMSFFETCHVNGFYKGMLSPLSFWLASSALSKGFAKKTGEQGVLEYKVNGKKEQVIFSLSFGELQMEFAKEFISSLNDKEIKKLLKGSGFNSKQEVLESLNSSLFSDRKNNLDDYFEKHGRLFSFFYYLHNSSSGNLDVYYTETGNVNDILYKAGKNSQVTMNKILERGVDSLSLGNTEKRRMADLHQYLFWLNGLYGKELKNMLIMGHNLSNLLDDFERNIKWIYDAGRLKN